MELIPRTSKLNRNTQTPICGLPAAETSNLILNLGTYLLVATETIRAHILSLVTPLVDAATIWTHFARARSQIMCVIYALCVCKSQAARSQ